MELHRISGTIVGPLAAGDVMADVEQMIEDAVSSLLLVELVEDRFDFKAWQAEWRQASERDQRGV